MYGMIPSANTESLSSAPPEKRLNSPKSPSLAFAKKEAKATASIPGVGT